MLTIELATPSAVNELASSITDEDAAELAAAGRSVSEALADADLQALRWHGRLVCLFGAQPFPGQPSVGVPWMLCTTALAEVPRRAMADVSARVVGQWHAQFKHLTNLIHRRNSRALRFVRWLGFTVKAEPCGPGGEFYIFEWRAHV
ncbi:hypothetical protein [Roseateles sp. PN1]|uniref:hypothetical protein n=1 Tax=Roseateles sp. PN1 TaxID=3137372 RepID=UPI003139D185